MKREAVAVLIGLVLGFVTAYLLRSHQASEAEDHARVADSLYQASQARDVLSQKQRDEFDRQRVVEQRRADSLQSQADKDLASAQRHATMADAKARQRLAAALTVEQQRDTYRALYQETVTERDNALLAGEAEKRATGHLRAMLVADSVELGNERGRSAEWKRTAETLAAANKDLLAHRRPSFSLKLGAGSFLAGAATATAVCVATGKCG